MGIFIIWLIGLTLSLLFFRGVGNCTREEEALLSEYFYDKKER